MEILKQINQYLLSISPNIGLYIILSLIGLLLAIIAGVKAYRFFKRIGEKHDTTPLVAFLTLTTLPITIPVIFTYSAIRKIYIFSRPYLFELLFLVIGLIKIAIAVTRKIIHLGKSSTGNEKNMLALAGAIKAFEYELANSKSKRSELTDLIAASLGGGFNISELHNALILFMFTMFEHQGFDMKALKNIYIRDSFDTSAKRIYELLMADLIPNNSDELDDGLPF